ncbi:hypothetical protein LCGC14_1231050 [marine sediment metagenome]|uniref:Uncharacterized protein n=1 Tax=marine sediment metagenome TaxID=412755 RepID=A0A0F9LCN2_9ZZZZ
MNADNHDNMVRIKAITLDEWKAEVTDHAAYLWCNDLIMLVERCHYELDKTDVMFGEGDLRERIEWLRTRMEDAEANRTESTS